MMKKSGLVAYETYNLVSMIPEGKVLTYGSIAEMIGFPKNSRMVGSVLKKSSESQGIPAWRVVNSQGRTVPGWTEQRLLLEQEGVVFKKSGMVDLKECLWKP